MVKYNSKKKAKPSSYFVTPPKAAMERARQYIREKAEEEADREREAFDESLRIEVFIDCFADGDFINILRERGINIKSTETRVSLYIANTRRQPYYDIVATNDKEAVVVEAFTHRTLDIDDVKYFLNDVENFNKDYSEHKNKTTYGAMVYIDDDIEDSAKEYAQKSGLFLFQVSGEENEITTLVNDDNFKCKSWSLNG